MFQSGTHIYKVFEHDYHKHPRGYVILGPPGIGKTTFVQNQSGEKKTGLIAMISWEIWGLIGIKMRLNKMILN